MKRLSALRVMAIGAILLIGIWLVIYLDIQLRPAPEDALLVEIQNIKTLREQFNQDAGKTRLILLLSPT